METWLLYFLLPLPIYLGIVSDPSTNLWNNKSEARNLDCTRLSQARAHELYPGKVPEPSPRAGTLHEFDALACSRRMMNFGEREDRDEVILSSLTRSVGEISEVASALGARQGGSDGQGVTWHVDAFYPDAKVARKISVAAKTKLAESGHRVSDKVPLLAAGDLAVLREMTPAQAHELACRRFFAQNILKPTDAFLGIMIVDPRETQLHAGVCMNGEWRWLR